MTAGGSTMQRYLIQAHLSALRWSLVPLARALGRRRFEQGVSHELERIEADVDAADLPWFREECRRVREAASRVYDRSESGRIAAQVLPARRSDVAAPCEPGDRLSG